MYFKKWKHSENWQAEVGCWKPENPCGHSQEEGAEETFDLLIETEVPVLPLWGRWAGRWGRFLSDTGRCYLFICSLIHPAAICWAHTMDWVLLETALCFCSLGAPAKPRAHPGCVTLGRALSSGPIAEVGGGVGPGAGALFGGTAAPCLTSVTPSQRLGSSKQSYRAVTRKAARGCWTVKNRKHSHEQLTFCCCASLSPSVTWRGEYKVTFPQQLYYQGPLTCCPLLPTVRTK